MKNHLIVLVFSLLALFACEYKTSSEERDNSKVDEQQNIYAQSQPIPFFKFSQDRDNLIQIYKMKNESRATYSVVRASGSGEILWHCPSVGFPLAADTQLTNGLQLNLRRFDRGNGNINTVEGVIEQAEPNGLYSSKNTDGTYVICVLSDGTTTPQYTESKVEVFTRPVKVQEDKNGKFVVVFVDGKPSMTMEQKKPQ